MHGRLKGEILLHGAGFDSDIPWSWLLCVGRGEYSSQCFTLEDLQLSDVSLGVHGNELTPRSSLRECTVGFSPCLARVTTRQLSAAF